MWVGRTKNIHMCAKVTLELTSLHVEKLIRKKRERDAEGRKRSRRWGVWTEVTIVKYKSWQSWQSWLQRNRKSKMQRF